MELTSVGILVAHSGLVILDVMYVSQWALWGLLEVYLMFPCAFWRGEEVSSVKL